MTKRRNCSARHTDSGDTSKRFSRGQSRDRDNSAPASHCSVILAELVSPPARSSAGPARSSSGLHARRAALFPVPGKGNFQQLDRSQTSNTLNDFSKTQLENALPPTQSSIALLV